MNYFIYKHKTFFNFKTKNTFLRLLDDTESWLYSEQAENQEKNVYIERLQALKVCFYFYML